MQNFTYHCHTNFMNVFDGKNSAEEMIAQAQKLGFKAIGISNHLIYHHNGPTTLDMMFNDYGKALEHFSANVENIRNAADKANIPVSVGFEVDYFPSNRWRDDYERMRSQLNVDYWIGAVHNLCSPDGETVVNLYDIYWHNIKTYEHLVPQYYAAVYDILASAIKSGYFDFMAHLDIFKVFGLGTGSEWDSRKRQLLDILAEYNLPFELNTSGWNKCGEQHPEEWVISEANQRNIPILISDDAHSVEQIGQHFERAEAILTSVNYQNRWDLTGKK